MAFSSAAKNGRPDCGINCREVSILTDVETFIYSFRMGARMMMDVLTDGTIKEIWQKIRGQGWRYSRQSWPFCVYSVYYCSKKAVTVFRNRAASETSFLVSAIEQMYRTRKKSQKSCYIVVLKSPQRRIRPD